MKNKLGHKLTLGQLYQSRYGSSFELHTLAGVFGQYADMEHKKTRHRHWMHVNSLVPYVRAQPTKRYLKEADHG